VRRSRALVRVPNELARPAASVKVLPFEIERAFMAANPGLRPDMMAVSCRRRIFDEIRICLDRDLTGFRSCPEVDQDDCRSGVVTVEGRR
jgi:ribonuclease T2